MPSLPSVRTRRVRVRNAPRPSFQCLSPVRRCDRWLDGNRSGAGAGRRCRTGCIALYRARRAWHDPDRTPGGQGPVRLRFRPDTLRPRRFLAAVRTRFAHWAAPYSCGQLVAEARHGPRALCRWDDRHRSARWSCCGSPPRARGHSRATACRAPRAARPAAVAYRRIGEFARDPARSADHDPARKRTVQSGNERDLCRVRRALHRFVVLQFRLVGSTATPVSTGLLCDGVRAPALCAFDLGRARLGVAGSRLYGSLPNQLSDARSRRSLHSPLPAPFSSRASLPVGSGKLQP